jgi:hypothetical protein
MRNLFRKVVALGTFSLISLFLLSNGQAVHAKTSLEYLKSATKPNFKEGHTLLPLSRWGWTMTFDTRVELCENWGYALEFGGYANQESVKELDNPNSIPSKLCALTASDPKRYPLFVLTDRACYSEEFLKTAPSETWCNDADGKMLDPKIWSPEAPTDLFKQAGKLSAAPLAKILEKAPIALVLNGGEYALSVYGHHGKYWEKDSRIMKAKGDKSWFEYISENKARQELPISDAFRDIVPNRRLYIYYTTDGSPYRDSSPNSTWWTWACGYKWMRPISDLPNTSLYYMDFNTGWTGDRDMLTESLNAVAQQISFADNLSYNWVCGGYKEGKFSDAEHYMGFLKCLYTAGMIGGVAGYFSYPTGGFEGNVGDELPSWLEQMMVLGHAQALFSHLEDYLRNGSLLQGPDKHKFSRDLPAYEFPTGDPEARVLARKHNQKNEWLITAWSTGGNDREVSVTIPNLGNVKVLARSSGSVYKAGIKNGKAELMLIDKDGMNPSAGLQ